MYTENFRAGYESGLTALVRDASLYLTTKTDEEHDERMGFDAGVKAFQMDLNNWLECRREWLAHHPGQKFDPASFDKEYSVGDPVRIFQTHPAK